MFTFQSIMFVSLGFLCALLLGFIVAPAFWARAVRLTTERMRASLPLSEQEIRAERDRLRAENAIRVHQLTAKIERARLYDARQKVEINRRDGTIGALERRLQQIETEREGSENARRVLEATITQRVPEIESRLMEARQLLARRDAEMKALQGDTGKTFRALDDAMQVNAQQRAEIDRLKMSLAGHGARTHPPAAGTESEVALRAELEKLRQRSRGQAAQIDQLRRLLREDAADSKSNGTNGSAAANAAKQWDLDPIPLKPTAANDTDKPVFNGEPSRLGPEDSEALRKTLSEQTVTIEKLTAELAAFEEGTKEKGRSLSLRETKTALKARATASEKIVAARDKSIAKLRKELAQANERLAQQASYYQNELRRLGVRRGTGLEVGADNGANATIEPPPLPKQTTESILPRTTDETVDTEIQASASDKPDQSLGERLAISSRSTSADTDTTVIIEGNNPAVTNAQSDEPPLEAAYDFDQHFEPVPTVDPPKTQPRGKLMDRIAGLTKR